MFHRHFDDPMPATATIAAITTTASATVVSRPAFSRRRLRRPRGPDVRRGRAQIRDPGARRGKAALRLRDHQGTRRAGRRRLFAEPRRRLSDADHARRDGLRAAPARTRRGASSIRSHRWKARRSWPRTRPRSTPFSNASAIVTRAASQASSRSSARCSICARRFNCACADAPPPPEQMQAIVDAIDAAAKAIERA